MRYSKKALITIAIIFIISFIGVTYELPYYIYKPGQADDLTEMVEVTNGHHGKGDLHLVTVSGGQATPLEYISAKILPFHQIVPINEARPEGISDEEYMQYQLHLMDNSQHSSMVVAYEAAGKEVTIISNGVYVVSVVEKMPADGLIKAGDKIIQVDDKVVKQADDLVNYVKNKKDGDEIHLTMERKGEEMDETVEVKAFPDDPEKVGIGIQLVTNEEIETVPPVKIKSGNIGGPSAGLMFSLEIYNQLTEEDITKGHHIAGTGEIDYDGRVKRIGGIDKKVVAADKEGIEIFFAPNEEGASDSNYQEAKATAEKIKTDMKIIPVDTFDDALTYLENL